MNIRTYFISTVKICQYTLFLKFKSIDINILSCHKMADSTLWSFRLSVKLPTRGQLGWFYFADLATLFIGQDSVQLPRVVSLSVQCKCRFWIWVTFKRWCKLVIKNKGLINKSGLKSNQGLQCKWGLSHLWCSMVPSVRNQDAAF